MSLDFTLYEDGKEVFSANITHNLGKMAREAGIYMCLWRPGEIAITKARDVAKILKPGVARLATEKAHFEQFDSPNGWGLWKHFLPFCCSVLQACNDHPEATVEVSI